ncbi:MAG: hypothetical protein PVI06_04170 [Desulfobacterales bacterium]|jgi:hypothetical protein
MIKLEIYPNYIEFYEYHGGTTIELTRKGGDEIFRQDWIMFDSTEAALEYFNNCCGV